MKINTIKLVFFSPTGGTKTVIQSISAGFENCVIELIDITKPEDRKKPLLTRGDELLIIAVPVYMGRVPALLSQWLASINADNSPAVCVTVYGNRVFDDALLELKDIMTRQGCKPIAAAAFIAEHSFSSAELPTAQGRPDCRDTITAKAFGKQIQAKILSLPSAEHIADIYVPGCVPYGGITELWNVDFIEVSAECSNCGYCSDNCPVSAINPTNYKITDVAKCITCCACIKQCSQSARKMKDSPVKEAASRLNSLYYERKDPVIFI